MITINKILKHLYKFSPEVLTLGEPLEDIKIVENFEQKYNLRLPRDYKYLLTKHNGIDLMGVSIYGFAGAENLETVYEFEHNEVAYPQYNYFVPFSPDGGGNFYCFDTRYINDESCPVVFWTSNYEYSEDDQPELSNESFADWIKEVLIEWTLESCNYDGSDKE
jgi:hypothetical protein